MPILSRIRKKFEEQKPFIVINIGVSMPRFIGIYLLTTFQAGGADISASSCNPLSTDDGVALIILSKYGNFCMV